MKRKPSLSMRNLYPASILTSVNDKQGEVYKAKHPVRALILWYLLVIFVDSLIMAVGEYVLDLFWWEWAPVSLALIFGICLLYPKLMRWRRTEEKELSPKRGLFALLLFCLIMIDLAGRTSAMLYQYSNVPYFSKDIICQDSAESAEIIVKFRCRKMLGTWSKEGDTLVLTPKYPILSRQDSYHWKIFKVENKRNPDPENEYGAFLQEIDDLWTYEEYEGVFYEPELFASISVGASTWEEVSALAPEETLYRTSSGGYSQYLMRSGDFIRIEYQGEDLIVSSIGISDQSATISPNT